MGERGYLGEDDLMELTMDLVHETDAAYLLTDSVTEDWVPKSQCEIINELDGRARVVEMPEWMAMKKGWI